MRRGRRILACAVVSVLGPSCGLFEFVKAAPPEVVCLEGQAATGQPGDDKLYAQTLELLRIWHRSLKEQPANGHPLDLADGTAASRVHVESLNSLRDVRHMLSDLKRILDHPETARACFDPRRTSLSDADKGFAPGAAEAALAGEVGVPRKLLAESFPDDDVVYQYLRETGEAFAAISRPDPAPRWLGDVSANAFPELWATAGWIPAYLEDEGGGEPSFRGGYLTTELVGPLGMLRIDSIDGRPFHGEVGLSVQAAGTLYPPHDHPDPELHVPISKAPCTHGYRVAIIPREHKPHLGVWQMTTAWVPADHPGMWAWHLPSWAVHAYRLSDCLGSMKGHGMASVWARTSGRDGVGRKTRHCVNISGHGGQFAGEDRWRCDDPPREE